ncbi:MAG TPA: hypothetical protein VLX92_11665 [Kofleriaceae bacterium]|nr:hypothetical protein [Kofleriaceae bacterium]
MMSKIWLYAALAGCGVAESAPPPAAQDRSADSMQRMMAQLVSAKVCDRLRGEMRPLRAYDRPAATGTLWIRDCHATLDGQRVTFAITGSGWRWNEEARQLREGTYDVHDEWRFDLEVIARGELAVGYEPTTRTATVTFTPSGTADVETTPTPNEDREPGQAIAASPVRDAVVGALSIAIEPPGNAPVLAPPHSDALAAGLTVRFPLCLPSELYDFNNGVALPDPAGSPATTIELHPGTLALFGPEPSSGPIDVLVRASHGTAHAALECQADAEREARGYLAGTPTQVRELAGADVRGEARLHVASASCPIAIALRDRGRANADLHWWRPIGAVAERGPISCLAP